MIPIAAQIIAVLYQHGRFTAASTVATAPVLAVYLIGAFPFAASTIVMRSFYAEQRMVFPMVVSTGIAIFSVPCYVLFSRMFGAVGIALASTVAQVLQFGFLYWAWENRHSFKADFFSTLSLFVKITAVAVLGFAISLGCRTMLVSACGSDSFVRNILVAAGSGLPAFAAAGACLHLFRIVDLRAMLGKIHHRVPAK
jgi:peptidoglycan biosynthesis protein MviN/MurJ (putative lipid II flippase)